MAVITIYGKVAEVVNEGYPRLKVWETYDFRGEARNRLWTVWLDNGTNIKKDDEIKAEGQLGTKVGTYNKPGQETKQVVEHSLNNSLVELIKAAEPKTSTPIEDIIKIMEPAPGIPQNNPF
jgi:folate-binding Fe-S cluster repair protein YgfZ